MPGLLRLVLGVAGLLNILFFAYPAPLLGAATAAAKSLVLTSSEMNREATGLAGVRHIAYETLGSTNAEALALARAGERGPLWISAQSQSAGRGRRGSALGLAAGQSLRDAAADRAVARRHRRRNCRLWPRWRCMTRLQPARRSLAAC